MEMPPSSHSSHRVVAGREIRKPNTLIIGAQKCGTHWLHSTLAAHEDVFMSAAKEPYYFGKAKRLTDSGFEAYLAEHFRDARDEAIVGEAPTSYFQTRAGWMRWQPGQHFVDVPRAVQRFLGSGVRFLVGLRQPVERAISAYLHHWRKGRIPEGQTLLEVNPKLGIVDIGNYYEHLMGWMEVYGRESFQVLLLEDIHDHPSATFGAICSFLKIEPTVPPAGIEYRGLDLEWEGDRLRLSNEAREKLGRGFKKKHPAGGPPPEPASIEYRELVELQNGFDEGIQRLEQWLGRDLSHWRGEPWHRFVRYRRS